jgi:hypothetical protein
MKTIWQSIYGVCKCVAKAVGADSPCRSTKTRKGSKEECTGVHRETARETESERRRDGERRESVGRRESEKSVKTGQKSCA